MSWEIFHSLSTRWYLYINMHMENYPSLSTRRYLYISMHMQIMIKAKKERKAIKIRKKYVNCVKTGVKAFHSMKGTGAFNEDSTLRYKTNESTSALFCFVLFCFCFLLCFVLFSSFFIAFIFIFITCPMFKVISNIYVLSNYSD